MKRPTTQHPLANDRGSAIVMVLGFLFLMMIIGMVFLFNARTERQVAAAQADGSRASLTAQSGVERAIAIIANACSLYTDDGQGGVAVNNQSFAPQLSNIFKDNGGVFVQEFPPTLSLEIRNQTGKLDPNFNGRPSQAVLAANGINPWPLATLGRTPMDVDFKYLDTNLKAFGTTAANNPLEGVLFTPGSDQRCWFSREQILGVAKQLTTQQKLTPADIAEFNQQWKNQDELFPISPKGGKKDDADYNANAFRDRDGKIYNRVSVEELRKRLCKIKFGSPIFLSPTVAQSVFDYWFNPDPANGRDKSYIVMHQERIAKLTGELPALQADKDAKMADLKTEWDAREPLRSESNRLNAENYNLKNRNELLNEYLTDPTLPAAQQTAYQKEIADNNQKIADNKVKIADLKTQIDPLNQTLQPLDSVINEINWRNHTIAHDNYIIGILNAWQEDGLPTLANFHKQVMAALKNPTTGENDMPWLTRILMYHVNTSNEANISNKARAYVEFLANLRDFLDGNDADSADAYEVDQPDYYGNHYGYGSTTVSDMIMPPDKDFDANHPFADIAPLYYNGIFYAGNERGPNLTEIRFRIVPRWENKRKDNAGNFVADLYVDVEAAGEIANLYQEYRYLTSTIHFEDAWYSIMGANGQQKAEKKQLDLKAPRFQAGVPVQMVDKNDQGKPYKLVDSFKAATYTAGVVDPAMPAFQFQIKGIKNVKATFRWAGVQPEFTSDRAWLLPPNPDDVLWGNQFTFKDLIKDLAAAEPELKNFVMGAETIDPRSNSVTGDWTPYRGEESVTPGSPGRLTAIGKGPIPGMTHDVDYAANANYETGRISTSFVRNGLPKSLWELGAVSRGEYGRTLNLAGGAAVPDGSYDKGDWELLDQLTLGCDDPENGESENGKINPKSATIGTWDAVLKSTRLADNTLPARTTPDAAEKSAEFLKTYGASTASPAQEIGNLNKLTPAMLATLTSTALPTRGHLALLGLQAGEPTDRQREEIVGKIANLLQTRYQYFEVISTGRDVQPNAETGGVIIKAEQKIRAVIERDAYKNTTRIISQEILQE